MLRKTAQLIFNRIKRAASIDGISEFMDAVSLGHESKNNAPKPAEGSSVYTERPATAEFNFSKNHRYSSHPSRTAVRTMPAEVPMVNGTNGPTNTKQDFPGMYGLPVPDPSNYIGIATGTGPGGEIVQRSQMKYSSAKRRMKTAYETPMMNGQPVGRRRSLGERITNNWQDTVKWVRNLTPWGVTGTASKAGRWPGAGVGAVAGGLTGAGLGALYNYLMREPWDDTSIWKDAIRGGLYGGGLGVLAGWESGRDYENAGYGHKTASAFSSNPYMPNSALDTPAAIINNRIMADSLLSFDQRNQLMSLVSQLPSNALSQLAPMIAAATGAGVGALIAKYLLGMGITGTVIISILGGSLGNRLGQPSEPAFNPVSGLGYLDTFGNRI